MDDVIKWLDTQQVDKNTYRSHKAALIASTDPFGLFADFISEDGTLYGYFNGELQTIDEPENKT